MTHDEMNYKVGLIAGVEDLVIWTEELADNLNCLIDSTYMLNKPVILKSRREVIEYDPLNRWDQAGELIEQFGVSVINDPIRKRWWASTDPFNTGYPDETETNNPREAVVKAILAAHGGDQ